MKKPKVYKDTKLAVALLAPSILLIVLLIGYPMIYNFIISFQKIPLNLKFLFTKIATPRPTAVLPTTEKNVYKTVRNSDL